MSNTYKQVEAEERQLEKKTADAWTELDKQRGYKTAVDWPAVGLLALWLLVIFTLVVATAPGCFIVCN